MAASIRTALSGLNTFLRKEIALIKTPVRHRFNYRLHRSKGKPVDEAKSFEEIVADLKGTPEEAVNIGFPLERKRRSRKEERLISEGKREELERLTRTRELKISLDDIKEDWSQSSGIHLTKTAAEYYGVYKDLFGNGFFHPVVELDVLYDYDGDLVTPVFRGNIISPSEAKTEPDVFYEAEPDTLWTLLMTAPDSHLQDNQQEYLQWMVGNIPGNRVAEGDRVCNYLPIFPVNGTGLHRYVFLLFKQNKKVNFSSHKRPENCTSLKERTFRALDFYKSLEDDITPAGLSFFQSEHDSSVRSVFWDVLGMKEPSFEFQYPPAYHPKQVRYPHKQPFNLYLDRYRDVKSINEEVLRERLKTVSPFKPKEEPTKYPAADFDESKTGPTWLKLKNRQKRMREMHWKDMD